MLQTKSFRIYPYRVFALLVLSWIMLLIIPGCSLRYAGAPTPSYNVDDDLAQLADQFKVSSSVSEYYKIASPTQKDRNKVISGRLVMIDIQYLKWLRTMTADQQLLNTSTDALVISLSLEAMITGGDTAKAVLSALAAGVTGVKTSIDKHYYYDKTMPALASAMNAQRKTVLVQIINGMNKPLEEYSFEQGLSDLNDYYQAGTLMGAVTAIQADAGVKAQAASEEIKRLIKPTSGEKQAVAKVKNIIAKINNALPEPDKAKLYNALASLGINGVNTADGAKSNFIKLLQRDPAVPVATAEQIINAIKKAGYTVED